MQSLNPVVCHSNEHLDTVVGSDYSLGIMQNHRYGYTHMHFYYHIVLVVLKVDK